MELLSIHLSKPLFALITLNCLCAPASCSLSKKLHKVWPINFSVFICSFQIYSFYVVQETAKYSSLQLMPHLLNYCSKENPPLGVPIPALLKSSYHPQAQVILPSS